MLTDYWMVNERIQYYHLSHSLFECAITVHGPSRLPAPTARCVELSFVRERLPGYLQANFGPQIVMETRRRGDGGSAEAAPIALSQRKRVRRYSL
jgi:hypothetical protein